MLEFGKPPPPPAFTVNATVPVGVPGVAVLLASATVAVQSKNALGVSGLSSVQETLVAEAASLRVAVNGSFVWLIGV